MQRGAVALLPIALIPLAAFFYGPLSGLLVQSFGSASAKPADAYAFSSYMKLVGEPSFLSVVGNSFYIAGTAFLIMVAIGYPLAYLIAFRVNRGRLLLLLLLV